MSAAPVSMSTFSALTALLTDRLATVWSSVKRIFTTPPADCSLPLSSSSV